MGGLLLIAGRGAAAEGFHWEAGPGYRGATLKVPTNGQAGFTLLRGEATGIRLTNTLADLSAGQNQILMSGSGVALGDVDGDGWCDIYLCRIEGTNALYRNLGNWTFADVTGMAGVACPGQHSSGAVFEDVDGDGDLDLLVNGIGAGTRLFLNDGKGRFTENISACFARKTGATSTALADVDGDGDLDVYVTHYRTNTVRSTGLKVLNMNGRRMLRPEDREQYEFTAQGLLLEYAEPDALYLNDGKGGFSPVSWTDGAFRDEEGAPLKSAPKEWGLSVMFRDVNGDGAPDFYVCNDFWSPDRFWINDGKGKFRALPAEAQRNSSTFSMGVDFADLNRDGHDDFLVLDMLSRDHARRMRQRAMLGQNSNPTGKIEARPQVERNTLFLNRGDGTYAEIAQLAGVQASEWSWGIVFVDVDLDGYEDALITTGHDFDTQDADNETRVAALGRSSTLTEQLLVSPRLNVPNVAFRNRGDLTFEETGARWGFNANGVSHGLALADLDNDGDLDVVVNNLNAEAGVYRNNAAAARVAVRLKGRGQNTRGIGARLKLTGGPVAQTQEMISGGRYLSGDDALRVFAAGGTTNALKLEVTWRNGARSIVENVKENCVIEVDEGSAQVSQKPVVAGIQPWFREATNFTHVHRDEPFDDFARQPMLDRRYSQLGPALAWADIDGDGWEDLMITSGRGGETARFQNRQGKLETASWRNADGPAIDDQTAAVGWSAGGTGTVWMANATYESGTTNAVLRRFSLRNGQWEMNESIPSWGSSLGPLAVADVDGDGALDLFAGGRIVPGRYPEAATSRLYLNVNSSVRLGQEFKELGMVSGAVFSDLDGDGAPELIVACEWGALKIFRREGGQFKLWDAPVDIEGRRRAFGNLRGWWNGVATGDFDGDGRMDIVASNWGRNHPWSESASDELMLYHGDFKSRGVVDFAGFYFERNRRQYVPWRDVDAFSAAQPWARERFTSYADYGDATIVKVLGEDAKVARALTASWLDSTVFLNRGDHFEGRSLPVEAQFSPAFATCVADFDGDGNEDVFLGQNFFGVEERTSRYDAGRGLMLRGDGRGGFKAVDGAQSGLMIYGEQRGAAAGDFDHDGRVDLVVGQSNAATKLYRNETARAGLRVRVAGPTGNPIGVGTSIRAVMNGRPGAAQEIHCGVGYASQDSATLVFAGPEPVTALVVRWPGGKVETNTVPAGAKEFILTPGQPR